MTARKLAGEQNDLRIATERSALEVLADQSIPQKVPHLTPSPRCGV